MSLIKLLKQHEGFSAKAYTCPAGKLTIGYGYNLEANPLKLIPDDIRRLRKNGITEPEAEQLLIKGVTHIEDRLAEKISGWAKLDRIRQGVLINMAFNLGIAGLLKFTRTLAFIEHGQYRDAAVEMQNSAWAKQVKQRALTLALMMDNGKAL